MDARKVYLGLAIHNHQPVGNFPSVFARAYEQAYLPMLEALERHPSVRLSLHYSGPLLDWLKENQPGFLQRVASLAQRDQVEVMGGAYYEPILPAIPDADKLGQIGMMGDFCEQTFGRRPAGFWLAERVWEPGLPLVLSQAGAEWTVVDDTHFKSTGLADEDLLGYYVTEEQGYTLKVFPSSKFLRYAVPFNTVERMMEYLHSRASDERARIVAMGDDGEKFGVWPKTYEHCWGTGQWMERFFTAIEENRSWLETVPLGIFARQFPPLGPIYLPCASYDEMLEWALPSDRSLQLSEARHRLQAEGREDIAGFMRGGYWRHFMVKYPEVNWMHKRMLRVHRKVHQACALDRSRPGLRELWQAQCNCPYWHGVFGGLYLADIRATTYQHLVEAEQQADRVLRPGRPYLVHENTDLDLDGREELFVDGTAFSLCLSPHRGGTIVEWDLHRPSFNLLSTLARRPEAYHKGLTSLATGQQGTGTQTIHAGVRLKDPNVARLLSYDRYPRFSLLDHFLSPNTSLRQFAACAYEELGDFADRPYECIVEARGQKMSISLRRQASLHLQGQSLPFMVEKVLHLQAGREVLETRYRIMNLSHLPTSGVFGIEWNINLLGGGHNDQAYYEVPGEKLDDAHLDSSGMLPRASTIIMGNRHLGIRLELSLQPAAEVWRFPVETVSNSEDGIEGLYQASCLLIRVPFNLEPQQETAVTLTWSQR